MYLSAAGGTLVLESIALTATAFLGWVVAPLTIGGVLLYAGYKMIKSDKQKLI